MRLVLGLEELTTNWCQVMILGPSFDVKTSSMFALTARIRLIMLMTVYLLIQRSGIELALLLEEQENVAVKARALRRCTAHVRREHSARR